MSKAKEAMWLEQDQSILRICVAAAGAGEIEKNIVVCCCHCCCCQSHGFQFFGAPTCDQALGQKRDWVFGAHKDHRGIPVTSCFGGLTFYDLPLLVASKCR
jgi:hypothetical protein